MYVIEELIASCHIIFIFHVHILEHFDQCKIEIIPLHARKNIHNILRQIVEERKASRKTHNGMFAELIGNEKPRYRLTEEQVFDQIFTILYSG